MMFLGFAGFLALCLPALAISTRRWDAERPGLHSQAERGNDQKQGCAFRHTSGLAKLAALWLCCWVLFAHPVLAATIKATPDRDPVRVDETFNLVFSTAEDVDDDPDFSPLADDFDIVSQNQGSQTSIINGKISQRQEWTLTLSPKRAGRLTIPPIAFGSDRSPAASVTVVDGGAAAPPGGDDHAELKLEVEASPKDPYVQAQVIYTVRILLRVNVVGADLSEPALPDALVEKLGEDRRYNTTRNGWEYTVIERKYAIFPQKSGLLRLDPVQLTAQVEVGGRSFFSRSTRAMRVKSEAIDLKVRPQPTAFTGSHWLPAAELTLEESWTQDPPQAKAGVRSRGR
ncbi:MAG: BatD family protein [Candidatus Methylumidiphilus sp.]